MKNTNGKRRMLVVGITIPILLAIAGAFIQYGKDKGFVLRSVESLETRIGLDENLYARDSQRIGEQSIQRWNDLKNRMAPLGDLQQQQAVTAQKLESIQEQQRIFMKDTKQFQRDTRQTLERILEKLSKGGSQ